MSTTRRHTNVSARRGTDRRPAYILIGIDTAGAHHVYRTTDESVHVLEGGERTHRFDLESHENPLEGVNDWIAHVEAARGFETQHLYKSFVDGLGVSA